MLKQNGLLFFLVIRCKSSISRGIYRGCFEMS